MTDFEAGYQDDALRLITAHNLFVNVWSGPVTVARLEVLLESERRLKRRHPEGFGIVSVVASMPMELLKTDEAARKKASAISREMGPSTLALADVVLGTGFWAATVRGITVSVNLVSRVSYPQRSFDNHAKASVWLHGHLAGKGAHAWTAAQLEHVLSRASEGRGR